MSLLEIVGGVALYLVGAVLGAVVIGVAVDRFARGKGLAGIGVMAVAIGAWYVLCAVVALIWIGILIGRGWA